VPELPEVESLVTFLTEFGAGRVIKRVEVASLSALKTYDPPVDALQGKVFAGATRRGKFLQLRTEDGPWLVIHLSRSGWVKWRDSFPKGPSKLNPKGPLALRVKFEDGAGFDVTEAATEKRLAVYVVRDPTDIEHVATLGPDPLDHGFTVDVLRSLLASAGGGQIKGVLTDQRVIAGVGNAYSDDALHLAKLSPFKPANKLTADEVTALHAALVGVLRDALDRSTGLAASEMKSEKKGGMRVHGRKGEKCPECGDVIREVSFATKSLQYCATCQTGGKPLADRRLSKLLK
jgi:formamidopyrimidine-DNA glycosylase